MKKILLSVSMLMIASTAFAQLTPGTWFLGGTLQFSSSANTFNSNANSTTNQFNVSPALGVLFSIHWEVGLAIGYSNTTTTYTNPPGSTTNEFIVGPFVKYFHPVKENSTFYYQFLGSVNLGFGNEGINTDSTRTTTSNITIGITPGLTWNPTRHFTFNLYYGNIAFSTTSEKSPAGNTSTTNTFGINITPGTLVFGVEYVFPYSKSK